MVGIFSRFSAGKAGHRRAQSALGEQEVLPPNLEARSGGSVGVVSTHGIEIAMEFKPVKHPTEPLDNDRPIQCPLPEPSILNDGRIWKERVSSGVGRREDLPVLQEGTVAEGKGEAVGARPHPPSGEAVGASPQPRPEGEAVGARPQPRPKPSSNRSILPSLSAPEHSIIRLLEESGI